MNLNDLSSYTRFILVVENSLCSQICIRYMYWQKLFYQMYELVMMIEFIRANYTVILMYPVSSLTYMLNILDSLVWVLQHLYSS
jgi:hypothetical protein